MFPKIYVPEKQEAKRLTCGFFVIQDYAGRWWSNGEWLEDWTLAERFYGPLPPDTGPRQMVKELKAKGHPCFLNYMPGGLN